MDSSLHRAAIDAAITSAYGSLTIREAEGHGTCTEKW